MGSGISSHLKSKSARPPGPPESKTNEHVIASPNDMNDNKNSSVQVQDQSAVTEQNAAEPVANDAKVISEEPANPDVSTGTEEEIPFPDCVYVSLNEITIFFSSHITPNEWINKDGKKYSKLLGSLSISHDSKRLSKAHRIDVSKIFLEKEMPELIYKHMMYVLRSLPDVFLKDQKIMENELSEKKKEKKSLEEDEGNMNKEEKGEQLAQSIKELRIVLDAQCILGNMLMALVNCSDIDFDSGKTYCEIGFVPSLLEIVDIYTPIIDEEDKKDLMKIKDNGRTRVLNLTLSTLHNLGKNQENQKYFEENECIRKVSPFLKAGTQIFAMKALLLLSHLIDENNSHLIMSSEEPIQLFLKYLKNAIKQDTHRYMGFSVSEMLGGLQLIARNDDNKKLIGTNGGIEVLALCLAFHLPNEEGKNEVLQSFKAVWILSFDEENKKLINQQELLMSALRKHEKCGSELIEKASAGALWEVEAKHQRNEKSESIEGHIMISYQWDSQAVMIKVRDSLQEAGYKVWMDVDQMAGSTLEAMAKGVEGASLILMGVSRKYKDSANCRSEAEYAFQLQKSIIPLMMEEYQPDGWLGFIVGAKFWIDFKGQLPLEESIGLLLREVSGHFQSDKSNNIKVDKEDGLMMAPMVGTTVHSASQVRLSVSDNQKLLTKSETHIKVTSWTSNDVESWLKDVNLYDVISSSAREELSGYVLVHLHLLRKESPELFYRMLRENVGLDKLSDFFKFMDEMEKLMAT